MTVVLETVVAGALEDRVAALAMTVVPAMTAKGPAERWGFLRGGGGAPPKRCEGCGCRSGDRVRAKADPGSQFGVRVGPSRSGYIYQAMNIGSFSNALAIAIVIYFLSLSDVCGQVSLRLDTTFRTTFVDLPAGTYLNQSYGLSVYPLEDGKVLLSGNLVYAYPVGGDEGYRLIARLNHDGTTDESFTTLGAGYPLIPWNDMFYSGPYARRHFMDGTLDYSFNLNTQANLAVISLWATHYHVYANGSVLMVGMHGYHPTPGMSTLENLAWVDSTGAFDPSIPPRRINYNGNYAFFGMLKSIDNGQFMLSGTISAYDSIPTGRLIRIHGNGDLDTTFHSSMYWGYASDCYPLEDGRLLVAGQFMFAGISDTLNVVRLMPNGDLDPTFNNQLQLTLDAPSYQYPMALGILPFYGTYVISGSFDTADGWQRGCMMTIDANGNVLNDGIAEPGCGGIFTDQMLYMSISSITPSPDGAYYAVGGFHGFADPGATDPGQQSAMRFLLVDNVGAEERERVSGATLSPNPADSKVVLETGYRDPYEVVVMDGLGHQIWYSKVWNDGQHIDVSNWNQGVYVLKVMILGKPVLNLPLVIQR